MAPKPKHIQENVDLPRLCRAAHIGILILKGTGCSNWSVLAGTPESHARVIITDEQQALLDEYTYVTHYLSTAPLSTVLYCDTCERWVLTTKNPGRNQNCNLAVGCAGVLIYVSTVAHRPKAGD